MRYDAENHNWRVLNSMASYAKSTAELAVTERQSPSLRTSSETPPAQPQSQPPVSHRKPAWVALIWHTVRAPPDTAKIASLAAVPQCCLDVVVAPCQLAPTLVRSASRAICRLGMVGLTPYACNKSSLNKVHWNPCK